MGDFKYVDTRENIRTVTSNAFITAKGLERLSLHARKMLYIAISQCRKTDEEFFEYEIGVKEFADLMNISPEGVYKTVAEMTDELMTSFITVMSGNQENYKKYPLFAMCDYQHKSKIKFVLNPLMSDFVLHLNKNFSQPLLNDFIKMNSPYSMAVWHLMQREMHSEKPMTTKKMEFYLSLKELREVTGTEDKLLQVGHFKSRVLDKAIREIDDNCGVKITYENETYGGKTIHGFNFTAISQFYIDPEKISQKTKDKVELGKLRIASKSRELTKEEKEMFDYLTEKSEQIELSAFEIF